ncbi:hypothetical protein [Devosia sp. 2618]|uniref:hypothetical protein n=1 Tax=Devosia sp. 2618 TaxID=3156454 RepID=UPI003393746D
MTGQTTDRRLPDLRLVAVVFLVAAITLVLRTAVGRGGGPFFVDADDAMRMVMVKDFVAGQGWYDLVERRLNTPFGAELHWSRLVDLPLALLVMLFTPILGASTALIAAGYVWPMALLALLLWLSALLAQRLVGPDGVLPALVLPVLSPAITAEFSPGRVDHHNVIILLTLAMVWAGIEAIRRPRFAILCGLLAATALAIAIESLPSIAAAILVMGMVWMFDAKRAATMRNFGIAFAVGAVVHLAIFRPPSRWFESACDVISPVYVGVAVVVGLVFTLASFVPNLRQPWQRFALLAVLGAAGLGVIFLLYPQCLRGPYGELDPWLQTNWIGAIVEARRWLSTLTALPAYAIAVGLPVLLAVVVGFYRVWRVRDDRAEWAALLVFLVCTAVVMLAQVRGARLAIMPAIPAAAWLIVAARQRYLANPKPLPILGLVASWLAFSGIVLALLVTAIMAVAPAQLQEGVEAQGSRDQCLVPSAFQDLAALPPERIMTPIDLGAHMMLYTPHEVVSAPYHRNQRGVLDTFRFFNDPIAEARTILDERGIGLVVICPEMSEIAGLSTKAPDSFASLYALGELPAWLHDVSLPDSPLKVYAVLPQ